MARKRLAENPGGTNEEAAARMQYGISRAPSAKLEGHGLAGVPAKIVAEIERRAVEGVARHRGERIPKRRRARRLH
ncbi:MAG: hypothetical protein KGI70_03610 [Patescibacteria group bacterium]|nr:hypothetical protein [Patescibacteria group bacterium]